jgi:hypothetical protein
MSESVESVNNSSGLRNRHWQAASETAFIHSQKEFKPATYYRYEQSRGWRFISGAGGGRQGHRARGITQ